MGSDLHFKEKDQTSTFNGERKLMQLGQKDEAKVLLITNVWNYHAHFICPQLFRLYNAKDPNYVLVEMFI